MIRIVCVLIATAFLSMPSQDGRAQNADLEAMELAGQLVKLSGSAAAFDDILPNIAERAKTTLIRSNPQMQLGIIDIVDRVALSMVEYRRDLDRVHAEIWASAFTKDQMRELIAFYSSPTGKIFANRYPRVGAAQFNSAQKWSDEISELMMGRVAAEFRKTMPQGQNPLEAGAALPESRPQ